MEKVWYLTSIQVQRGKSGSNDASAEFIGKLRKVMDDADVYFQMAELGKVDAVWWRNNRIYLG